jgi:uncharacterized membrane protein (DUF4010 family)
MDGTRAFENLAIALLLGLFVGLQRERTRSRLGGIRTFGLITAAGTLAGLVAEDAGGWVFGAGLLAVVIVVAAENVRRAPTRRTPEPAMGPAEDGSAPMANVAGITTEVAIVIMYLVGAYLAVGVREVAVAAGAGTALILNAKPILHGFARRLGDRDVTAIMQFALMTFIILPIVPDRAYGPYRVLNPHQIWLMVVLVVGISLGGYIAYKFLGQRAGLLLGGILGGVISSTATTVSYARRAATGGDAATGAAIVVITIASSVLYVRLLLEVSAVAPGFLVHAGPPLGIMLALSIILAAIMWVSTGRHRDGLPEQQNPTELKSALVFAGVYAVVILAVAAGQERFGSSGLYVVAAISGLTDMDAITLSASRLVAEERVDPSTAWRAIILACMSNTMFKAGVIASLGGRRLLWRAMPVILAKLAVGAGLIAFWHG